MDKFRLESIARLAILSIAGGAIVVGLALGQKGKSIHPVTVAPKNIDLQVRGDANHDGVVNISDITYTADFIAKVSAMDANRDGYINEDDLQEILSIMSQ